MSRRHRPTRFSLGPDDTWKLRIAISQAISSVEITSYTKQLSSLDASNIEKAILDRLETEGWKIDRKERRDSYGGGHSIGHNFNPND